MNVLMVGVDKNRNGGMWTVAENFINSKEYNQAIKLTYIATSTGGSAVKRILKMFQGYVLITTHLLFNKVDIVHIHMAEKGSVYRKGVVIRLAKLFNKKVVVQMHAGPIMDWYDSLPNKQQKIVKRIFNSPDKMLVLGEYWRNQLVRLIPREKIDILYNGAECGSINPYNNNGNIILYMGLIKKTKGAFDLVDAIAQIDKELPCDIKVCICGLDEKGEMNQYIHGKGLQNRIVLPGWVTKEQRLELFKETIISVLPSYFEALSMTIIESMCHGIPVVTTSISTMPELLGEDIHLVTPGDVNDLARYILSLAKDKSKREELSGTEFERAKKLFSIEKNIETTLNFYNSIM